ILLMLVLSLVSATVSGFMCRELAQEVQALSAEAEQLEEQGAYTERLELSKQAMVLEDRLVLRQLGVVLTFSVLSAVLIGVLADRIYLREARRRILDAHMYNRYPDGGTSVGLALVGIPVVLVYNGIIEAVSDRILNALWGL
ncbi:MAG: hypothetical protein IJZ13_03020, partial [Clostridia bacterium]|nr:hypothetical protein [Clostridia bacterium]